MVLRWLLQQHTTNNQLKPHKLLSPTIKQKLILFLNELPYKDCYIYLFWKLLCIRTIGSCSQLFFQIKKDKEWIPMGKYNRLCITISDENNSKLDSLDSNNKILSKSAIVDLALTKFLKNATAESIASEISEQLVVD